MAKDKGLTEKAIKAGGINADGSPKAPPYKMYDRDRLFLRFGTSGSRRWAWAYRLDTGDGKGERDFTYQIGRYPDVSIDAAREARRLAALEVEAGRHPAQVKAVAQAKAVAATQAAAKNTLWENFKLWREDNAPGWSVYYCQQVDNFMSRYIEHGLGARAIDDVTTPELVTLLKGIAKRGTIAKEERKAGSPTIAKLVCMWLGAVYSHAMREGRCARNPVKEGELTKVVKRAPVKNNLALSESQFRDLLTRLEAYGGNRATKIMIELLALFFVRTGELRQAEWQEFDLSARQWVVPASRMKKKNQGDHVVPLSPRALELLAELRLITGKPKTGKDWLFRNIRRQHECMSATTVNRALESMGLNGAGTIGFAAHGFRGSASTLLHKQKFKPEWIETQLAHQQGSAVAAVYNKYRYIDERTEMMTAWSDYVHGLKTASGADATTA